MIYPIFSPIFDKHQQREQVWKRRAGCHYQHTSHKLDCLTINKNNHKPEKTANGKSFRWQQTNNDNRKPLQRLVYSFWFHRKLRALQDHTNMTKLYLSSYTSWQSAGKLCPGGLLGHDSESKGHLFIILMSQTKSVYHNAVASHGGAQINSTSVRSEALADYRCNIVPQNVRSIRLKLDSGDFVCHWTAMDSLLSDD